LANHIANGAQGFAVGNNGPKTGKVCPKHQPFPVTNPIKDGTRFYEVEEGNAYRTGRVNNILILMPNINVQASRMRRWRISACDPDDRGCNGARCSSLQV